MKSDAFHALISVGASILVDAPVHSVYEQWTKIEEFPKFMNAIREVRRIQTGGLHIASAAVARSSYSANASRILPRRPSCAVASTIGRSKAKLRRSPLTA